MVLILRHSLAGFLCLLCYSPQPTHQCTQTYPMNLLGPWCPVSSFCPRSSNPILLKAEEGNTTRNKVMHSAPCRMPPGGPIHRLRSIRETRTFHRDHPPITQFRFSTEATRTVFLCREEEKKPVCRKQSRGWKPLLGNNNQKMALPF